MRGIIQIPIILMAILGMIAFGGIGYSVNKVIDKPGVKEDKNDPIIKELERQIADLQQYVASSSNQSEEDVVEDKAIELKQEIDAYKKQSVITPSIVPIVPTLSIPLPTQSTGLTNVEIIAKVKPSTVYIKTKYSNDSGITKYGSGSGIIIPGGYILTNAHVIEGVYKADITLSDKRKFTAQVVGRDEEKDVALLLLPDSIRYYPFTATLGNSEKVSVGENIFTLGYPFGLEGDVSFKEGTVSRWLDGDIEISADIKSGNSGGPLVDKYGHVVGINYLGRRGPQTEDSQGWLHFAIPINKVKELLPRLKDGYLDYKVGSTRPPQVSCGTNTRVTAGGDCECSAGYIGDPKIICKEGTHYCTTEVGIQYRYDSVTNSCTCNINEGYQVQAGRCVPIE